METCTCISDHLIRDIENKKELRDVIIDIRRVAREQHRYELSYTAARRSAILLGSEEAAISKQRIAEIHFSMRKAALTSLQQSFSAMIQSVDEKQLSQSFEKGFTGQFMKIARETVILRLLKSNISAEEAKTVVKKLDMTTETFQSFTTIKDVGDYAQKHIDELMGKKMGNPSSAARNFCIFILAISSILALLYAVALYVCIIYSWLGMKDKCQYILDNLLDNVCGREST